MFPFRLTAVIKQALPLNETVKVFAWDLTAAKPYINAQTISKATEDFYGDNLESATYISDISKQINGSINTSGDVDYIKFIAPETSKYAFDCFSTIGMTAALYDSNGQALLNGFQTNEYSLTAGSAYYVKLYTASTAGDYIFTIQKSLTPEAKDFNIYDFDVDVNVYKKSIIKICEDLYYSDIEKSKKIYNDYENVLSEDARLHSLPAILNGHPKDLADFDNILNQYYKTKYAEFMSIKQKYLDIIDENSEIASSPSADATEPENGGTEAVPEAVGAVIGKGYSSGYTRGNFENVEASSGTSLMDASAPSFTIVGSTATTVTYNAVFPQSGIWGNMIDIVDFNASDGLTRVYTYGSDEYRTSGQETITGLQPGGIYIIQMYWYADDKNNSICRFVQLPNNTTENLEAYSGGRVTATLEAADKALASSSNFNAWLSNMDKAYNKYKELTGYTPYNSQKIDIRSTRNNLNNYWGIDDGHDYWLVVFGYYDYTRIFKYSKAFYQGQMRRLSNGDWGWLPMHEMSHVFDNSKWEFDGETLAQLKTVLRNGTIKREGL